MAHSNQLCDTNAAYAVAIEKTEFVVNPTVRFVGESIAGYPALPALSDYISVGYDDSAWPEIQLPAFGPDYVSFGYRSPPPPGTLVPPTMGDARGTGHWVARFRVTFPDYNIPAGCTMPGATPGDRVYILMLNTDNVGNIYLDGEEVLINNGNYYDGDYSNTYALYCNPGEHLLVIDKYGDTATDFMDVAIARPVPLTGTGTVDLAGDFTVTAHHAPIADANPSGSDQTQFVYYDLTTPAGVVPSTYEAATASRNLVHAVPAVGKGDYLYTIRWPAFSVFEYSGSVSAIGPTNFTMLAQTRARGKILTPLHIPKAGVVPDGVLAPSGPSVPITGVTGIWQPFAYNVLVHDNSWYAGSYLRVFHGSILVPLTDDGALVWTGPTNAVDNRTDGTGMALEVDMYFGPVGDPSHEGFGSNNGLQPWDHSDRFATWTETFSNGSHVNHQIFPGILVPADTEVWLVCQQWPDGEDSTLPFDPAVSWNPMTDMGTFSRHDTGAPVTVLDMASLIEVQVPVPSAFWGP